MPQKKRSSATDPEDTPYGTFYPVINVNQGLWNPLLTKFRRAIAPLNPFATQQVPSHQRIAMGARWGNQFYVPDPYPNSVTFSRMAPNHYDPLEGMNRQGFPLHHRSHGPGSTLIPIMRVDKYPRGCVNAIKAAKRCEMVNGKEKCQGEVENIINVCPRWAVEDMQEKKRFMAKVQAIQLHEYRSAMEVSDYNKGRSMADLEVKTWEDGTRTKLRPDTMWADDRYAHITQKDINAAKERHSKREAQKEQKHPEHHAHYDWVHSKTKEAKPLYP